MIIRFLRWFVGRFILAYEKLFTPKGIARSPEAQAEVDREVDKLAVYQLPACPFCLKIRFAAARLSLKLETRDVGDRGPYYDELVSEGGKFQTPCLKIQHDADDVTWLYESSEIVDYLDKQFGQKQ